MLALASLTACDEWTDTESLDIVTPSIESQNPELYAQYVKALCAYKASDHSIVMALVNNPATTPSSRSEHLTSVPDSVDYIVLNNVLEVSATHRQEIAQVHAYATKVLALVSFDNILDNWKANLAIESAKEGYSATPDEEAAQFVSYCSQQTAALLKAADGIEGIDGIVAAFTGYDLNSLATGEQQAAEQARQQAFTSAIAQWKAANADKALAFKGMPQNLIDRAWLNDCKYILLDGQGTKNQYEMNYLSIMASVDGVPTDRFVLCTTTPYKTASGSWNGQLSDGTSAIVGAAKWAIAPETNFAKAGIAIDNAEMDYYNIQRIYPNIRAALQILAPTVK